MLKPRQITDPVNVFMADYQESADQFAPRARLIGKWLWRSFLFFIVVDVLGFFIWLSH